MSTPRRDDVQSARRAARREGEFAGVGGDRDRAGGAPHGEAREPRAVGHLVRVDVLDERSTPQLVHAGCGGRRRDVAAEDDVERVAHCDDQTERVDVDQSGPASEEGRVHRHGVRAQIVVGALSRDAPGHYADVEVVGQTVNQTTKQQLDPADRGREVGGQQQKPRHHTARDLERVLRSPAVHSGGFG